MDWDNPAFEAVTAQAAVAQDPDVRKALYKQAEELLVETDAVIIPIYHHGGVTATKASLDRTYGTKFGDIAGWRFTDVSAVIGPGGGELESFQGDVAAQFPAGALMQSATVTLEPATGMPPTGSLARIGHTFDLSAVNVADGQPSQLASGHSYTVVVDYKQAEVGPTKESSLGLYWWDGSIWSQQGISSSVDTTANRVTAQVNHFSVFTVLGTTHKTYLPLTLH